MSTSAKAVRFEGASMIVDLADGRTLSVPLAWFPRLLAATSEERERVRISRRGLHWGELDEDVSVASLLAAPADDPGAHDAWLRAKVREALDDPRPPIPHAEVMAELRERIDQKRHAKP